MSENRDIARAILRLLPEAQFIFEGDDYSQINWLDERPKPTWEQIQTEINNPTPQPEPTVADKLASVGLSLEELKTALGGTN